MEPVQAFIIALIKFLDLYIWVLIARLLLSWFPNINWYEQPWRTLSMLTDPLLAPFRRLIPPLGGIDFSPIVLFIVIQLLQQALAMVAANSLY